MPRAVAGMLSRQMLHASLFANLAGVLVECDPSIKAILIKIDTEHNHDFIVEDIDDEHVLVKNMKQDELKRLLKEVRCGMTLESIKPLPNDH
jgi:TFIIH basal transcription factor complex TTD-A subunit